MKQIFYIVVIILIGNPWTSYGDELQQLDEKWVKQNQEMLAMVNGKKYSEAFKKGDIILNYLKTRGLMQTQEAATTYNNLGMAYLAAGQFNVSYDYLIQALQLRTKLFGNDSIEVGTVWLNMAHLCKMQAQYIFELHKKNPDHTDSTSGKKE